ncbi:alpha/beta fold hydrolase [Candidatus Protochlamydia phocaeensis]|uniref:alpha/beta fold hydrolase n=1 Tax=Candidatus Protochlamydia phocaeensis TaxID=1414722 RepID=UPI000838A035|nr:alpha/beta hydrolase [Candidatus Protochlamydia phocaeensis]
MLSHHTRKVNGIKLHYVEVGEGPPVVLLHGFPEMWFAWRKQIPVLAQKFRVIVPDLRGYGYSEKPASGYDKRTMARDIYELLQALGIQKIALIGHDRGARVATRFAKDFPDVVDRLAVLDNVPTRIIFESMDAKIAKGHWFFIFNRLPDLPEALIQGREEIWLRHFYTTWCYNPETFTDEEIAVYVNAYSQPGALRGAFSDYRAAEEDVAQDKQDENVLIQCPILALWGENFDLVGQMFDVLGIWKTMASQVQGISIPQCGHLPHEECPDPVNDALLNFLGPWLRDNVRTNQQLVEDRV